MKALNPNLIKEVLHDYDAACEELNRPAHDVVTHSVCHLTRKSIRTLLQVYLISKKINFSEIDSMEKLVYKSIAVNPSLVRFDFSILSCSHLPSQDIPVNCCMNEEKVSGCFRLLNSLKNYLLDEMKVSKEKLE